MKIKTRVRRPKPVSVGHDYQVGDWVLDISALDAHGTKDYGAILHVHRGGGITFVLHNVRFTARFTSYTSLKLLGRKGEHEDNYYKKLIEGKQAKKVAPKIKKKGKLKIKLKKQRH